MDWAAVRLVLGGATLWVTLLAVRTTLCGLLP